LSTGQRAEFRQCPLKPDQAQEASPRIRSPAPCRTRPELSPFEAENPPTDRFPGALHPSSTGMSEWRRRRRPARGRASLSVQLTSSSQARPDRRRARRLSASLQAGQFSGLRAVGMGLLMPPSSPAGSTRCIPRRFRETEPAGCPDKDVLVPVAVHAPGGGEREETP
jgi:hypothetical protein